MNAFIRLLAFAARHGRLLLIAGLAAGIGLPPLALAMRPWLQELVAGLMFIAALRIGPRQAFGALRDIPAVAGLAIAYQVGVPLAIIAVAMLAGVAGSPVALALTLMAAASPISGSPNLTILTGGDPAPSLRLLIVGTALLPLTVIPVFWLTPAFGSASTVLMASARLFAVIAVATSAAFAVRHFLLPNPKPQTVAALDGLSAIAMAVVVVGLMASAGPALGTNPASFFGWLAVAFAANFGLQAVAALVHRRSPWRGSVIPFGIAAGNRNIALFLVALPAAVTDPLLLFIGCYQIPMYLTPVLMARFYRRFAATDQTSSQA